MNNKPLEMLIDMYQKLRPHYQDEQKTIDSLISWVAVRISFEHQVLSVLPSIEISDYFYKNFSLDLLKQDNHDWLGELLIYLGLNYEVLVNYTPSSIKFIHDTSEAPKKVLIKNYSTGRKAISLNHKYPDKAIYFGLINDLTLYRIALLNSFIYNIPSHLLFVENFNISKNNNFNLDSNQWKASNKWYPSLVLNFTN
jgi:hypothetical protein